MIMRTIFRPFAIHAAYSPIETIVFFSIVGTLAYFYILNAIKHSVFLAQGPYASGALPLGPGASVLRPAYVRLSGEEWVSVPEGGWWSANENEASPNRAELQQIVWAIKDSTPPSLTFSSEPSLLATVRNMSEHIVLSLANSKYTSICYRASASNNCITSTVATERSFTQTLVFSAGTREPFMDIVGKFLTSTPRDVPSQIGFEFQPAESDYQERSGSWVTYAAKVVGMRFWSVMKRTPSLDIMVILAGYVLMHLTFVLLFLRSRALGSSFSVTAAIFSSSVLAMLLALSVAIFFRIPMDVVALSEALPFLVCTVGFDKPMRLARAVFNHPFLLASVPPKLPESMREKGVISTKAFEAYSGTLLPSSEVILSALSAAYQPIIRDYGLEIAVLTIGANSGVSGLKEVCAVAAILLSIDCVLMCTFLSSVLAIMVEVRRIKAVRALKRSQSSSALSSAVSTPSTSPRMRPSALRVSAFNSANKDHGKMTKVKNSIFGVKGAGLDQAGKKEESPVARLKLLLIITFLTLHLLNLVTPLASPRAHFKTAVGTRKVDVSSDIVIGALNEVVPGNMSETFASQLVIKVHPVAHVNVLPPPSTVAVHRKNTVSTRNANVSSAVDIFLVTWASLIGDPLLSKWIVLVLALSISLNGYLLKGIATGVVGKASLLPPPTKDAGVRFQENEAEEVAVVPITITAPAVAPIPSTAVPSFTPAASPSSKTQTLELDDVDKRLQLSIGKKFAIAPSPLSTSTNGSDDSVSNPDNEHDSVEVIRPYDVVLDIFENGPRPVTVSILLLHDEEVIMLCQKGKIAAYALEKNIAGQPESIGYAQGLERAVRIRRALISRASVTQTLESSCIPMSNYDYTRVQGACCENVVGYIPIPLGIAGPLKIDGVLNPIPMATAEGTLVASTSRGCKALNAGGGVTTVLTADAMTRGPAIDFPSIVVAAQAKAWLEDEAPTGGYNIIKTAFESTSRFARMERIKVAMAGRTLFVRFATKTGDAMGMNMISKGTEKALEVMQTFFPDMIVLALSGNYCTDKKPAAINWIEGRGKSVVAEAVIPGAIVKSVLKTTVAALCNLNVKKNLIGSAMAGSVGGFNAHAANILTAVFLATGQDPAQNVESSNCMTLMEPTNNGEDLLMTVSMPSIEVGTIGGGTVLAPQGAVLEMLNLKGAHPTSPGQNAQSLSRLIASAVMAGELSLMSALAAGHLVRAHLVHNRSQVSTPAGSRPATPGLITPVGFGFKNATPINGTGNAGTSRVGGLIKAIIPLTPSSSTSSIPNMTPANS